MASSYPDEAGFAERSVGMLEAIREEGFGQRSLAVSTCPDTGGLVRTWAVEGEEIISPYTGRRYRQGPTGYFGPKAREADGRIAIFGGDPLKYDLPPAIVRLQADPADPAVWAFLSIPGNTRQHYHFAAKHWARLLGLVGVERLPPAFASQFWQHVAEYSERRRPSDGDREHRPVVEPFELPGRAELHLGGGGTENHRLMWRTSAYLYAEMAPPGAVISGLPATEVRPLTAGILRRWLERLYAVGVGEWTSSTYYPHSLQALANLYDFAADAEMRAVAQASMDYYVLTYGLKRAGGLVTGAQKRGTVPTALTTDMDRHLWLWAPSLAQPRPPAEGGPRPTSLAQLTSGYRPNAVLTAILQHTYEAPTEILFRHPDYEMQRAAEVTERLTRARTWALGSAQLASINNSLQQVCWSLTVHDPAAPLPVATFTGGQPRWRTRGGHSPYDQWLSHGATLLLVSGPSATDADGTPWPTLTSLDQLEGPRGYDRRGAMAGPLAPVPPPQTPTLVEYRRWWHDSLNAAAVWLWAPADSPVVAHGPDLCFTLGTIAVLVRPWRLAEGTVAAPVRVALPPAIADAAQPREAVVAALRESDIYVFSGSPTGFALEVVEGLPPAGPARDAWLAELWARPAPTQAAADPTHFTYPTASGDKLTLGYRADRLRADRWRNGSSLDEGPGPAVESPFFTAAPTADGWFTIRHPQAGGYRFRLPPGAAPEWAPLPPTAP